MLTKSDYRKNLVVSCFHEGAWGFGMAFHTFYATIPLFLQELNAPVWVLSSVMGAASGLMALPQLWSAYLAQGVRHFKRWTILLHLLLIPPMLWAGYAFFVLRVVGEKAIWYYGVTFIGFSLTIGFLLPVWSDFLKKASPPLKRGNFFGWSFAFNSSFGVIGGLVAKGILGSNITFPANFGAGFFIYAVCMLLATSLYLMIKVPDSEIDDRKRLPFRAFLEKTKRTFIHQDLYRNYLWSRALFTANLPAVSLYAVYSRDKLDYNISEAGLFVAIAVLFGAMGSLVVGKISDRFGVQRSMQLVMGSYLAALVTIIMADSILIVYMTFVFVGIGNGAILTAHMTILHQLSGQDDNRLHWALADTVQAPFIIVVLLGTGLLVPLVGYDATFVILGVGMLAGIIKFSMKPFNAADPVVVETK